MGEASPVGLDVTALERVLGELVGSLAGPLQAELLPGGRSNLTYLLTDGRSRWVLRRPPLGVLTPSAHDMGREYRMVEALQGSGVPVARTVVLCEDPAVIGAPFSVVSHVGGVVLRTPVDMESVGEGVLLVEDEAPLADAVRRNLVADGFAVDVAATGPDGLWAARERDYDVVVLDIMLPGMSG